MKLTDLIIIFVIFTIPFNMMQQLKIQKLEMTNYRKMQINHILDSATMDAMDALIEKSDINGMIINKNKALEAFFHSMHVAFDIENDPIAQMSLKGYIPMIGIIDVDGFIPLSQETYIGADGCQMTKLVWMPKKYFADWDEHYIYQFTLDSSLKIYDRFTNVFYEGEELELKAMLPGSILDNHELFETKRRRCIIETIETEMSNSMAKHNIIARSMGVFYEFSLPVIDQDDFNQTIDDIGFVAFFQGMPIGIDGLVFNSYAFSSAQYMKAERYFIQEDVDSVVQYYHREKCDQLVIKDESYSSREDCALKGAYPCDHCKP